MGEASRGSDGSLIRAFQHPGHTAKSIAEIPRDCFLCPWVPRLGIKYGKPIIAHFELKFVSSLCRVHGHLI